MIIGVNEQYILVSIGNPSDENAFSIKIVDDQEINLDTNIYKYDKGAVIDLGLKPELAMTEEEKILKELKELDSTVDRQWEDYYIKWQITPVDRIAVVITQKEELRKRLKELKIEQ